MALAFAACGAPGDDPDAVEGVDAIDVRETGDAGQDSVESDVCVPLCQSRGWECGYDGCGGSCGECEVGECHDGDCWEYFGLCENFDCGEIYGEKCGDCDQGWDCKDNICVHTACDGRECGDDGFGGDCGECEDGYPCYENTCGYVDFNDCTDRECGPGSMGLSCGECTDGRECVEMIARCLYPACTYPDDLPTSWGTAAVLDSLHVPADAAEKTVCHDYTGDGVPDSNLTGMASQMNPELDKIATWNTPLILEFAGMTDPVQGGDFVLNLLYGQAAGEGAAAGILADPLSYMGDSCVPWLRFLDASVADGEFSGRAGKVAVFVNVSPTFRLQVDLIDANITGTVTVGEGGVAVADGTFSGILTSANMYAAGERLQNECDRVPPPEVLPEICPYLGLARSGVPRIVGPGTVLLTLHRNDDGTYVPRDADHPGNAGAMCFKFTAAPAVITGYIPAVE